MFFNGTTDFIDVAAHLDGMNEMTVCVWVNVEAERWGSLLGEWGGPNPRFYCWSLVFCDISKKQRASGAWICNSDGKIYHVRGKPVEYGKWKHLCFSYKAGDELILYENGKPVNSTRVDNMPIRASERYTAKIGTWQDLGDGGSKYNGILDDLRVYDRALSRSEIKRLCNSRK